MFRQSEKNLLNSNSSSTCPDNMVNFDPLTAEIGWWVWGTPANFNRFRALASLLHRHLSMEVNQTLHGVWLSPGLVHYIYIYILGGSCPLTEFCQVQNSLCGQVSRSPVLTALLHYCTALEHFVAWYKEWNHGTFAPHHFEQRAPPTFRGRPSRLT